MSQKFILIGDQTAKKTPYYLNDPPKRFTRKRSQRQRSFDSKRSKGDSTFQQYIRNPPSPGDLKLTFPESQDQSMIQQSFSVSTMLQSDREKKPKKIIFSRNTSSTTRQPGKEIQIQSIRISLLETQLKAKQGQIERMKLQLQDEKEKRRKIDGQKRQLLREINKKDKQIQEISLQMRRIMKQNDILVKQVQFLQRINYDQKTRNIQSFRQKIMEQQLLKARSQLKSRKTNKQVQLENQLLKLNQSKHIAQQQYRSMQSLVAVQKFQLNKITQILQQQRKITKDKIFNSQQYIDLKQKFKKFIEQYKEVRKQNNLLKTEVEKQEAELILSDSDSS